MSSVQVDSCISWRTPNRNGELSTTFTVRNLECDLEYFKGRKKYDCDYRLYLCRDGKPDKPFDLSVQLIIGTDVVSHCSTTYGNTSDGGIADGNIIWKGHASELSKLIADFEQQELLFRVTVLDDTTGQKTADTNPALTSFAFSRPSYHTEALSRDLAKLIDDDTSSDVEISCSGQVFKVHRNLLSVRSEVFAAMLQSNMAEGRSGRVDIADVDGDVFVLFLRYVYTGILPDLTIDSAEALYEVADKYAMLELRKACTSFLCRGLTKDNACDILVLSDLHSDREFKEVVIQFMMREKIPRTYDNWSDFCEHHPKLATEVLNSCCEKFFAV